ncbi:MAG: hypothetical protein ACKVOY_08145 [Burkholderiaceae bacterium]
MNRILTSFDSFEESCDNVSNSTFYRNQSMFKLFIAICATLVMALPMLSTAQSTPTPTTQAAPATTPAAEPAAMPDKKPKAAKKAKKKKSKKAKKAKS